MDTDAFRAGAKIGGYEIVRCIGQGAMGTVFEAVHQLLRRRVAIKVWHSQLRDHAEIDQATRHFLREGRAAARVHHPHVVDLYDFGVEGGRPFLVMEFVDGETLADLLRRQGKLPLEQTVDILLPVLSAVAELHEAGIVHRDIKPANILLTRGQLCPKLTDFGISKFDDGLPSSTSSGNTFAGTPQYMAPEMLEGEAPPGPLSDQYALGVTLYECTAGERPFSGSTEFVRLRAAVASNIRPPSTLTPSLPPAFDAVVLRAMHRVSHERYRSVDELAEALLPSASPAVAARWRDELGIKPQPFAWGTKALAGGQRPWWLVAAVAGLSFSVGVVGAAWSMARPSPVTRPEPSVQTPRIVPERDLPQRPPVMSPPSVQVEVVLAPVSAAAASTAPAHPAGSVVRPPSALHVSSTAIRSSTRAPSSGDPAGGDSSHRGDDNGAPILDFP